MSNIDPSKPEEGFATTGSVRQNFQHAADEIDANVAAIAANAGRLNGLDADQATQDGRLDGIDAGQIVQDDRITDLENRPAPGGTPVGIISMFGSATPPFGYLLCDGSAIDPAFTQLIGIVGPNTPDLRGQFVRGWSVDANTDPNGPRAPLSYQADNVINHTHPITDPGHNHIITDPTHNHALNDPGHSHAVADPGHFHSILTHTENGNNGGRVAVTSAVDNYGGRTENKQTGITVAAAGTGTYNSASGTGITINNQATGITGTGNQAAGALETRPKNVALAFIIKHDE